MSTFNELCGVVPIKDNVSADVLAQAIAGAIGAEDQASFFPVGDVIVFCEDTIHVDFGMIPPEGASLDIIEKAMVAIAPSVDLLSPQGWVEIEMVPGYNVGDSSMYRFIGGHLECSGAALCSDGNWFVVGADLVRSKATATDAVEGSELTEADWTEIYYALQTKVAMVERGQYGPDLRGQDWPAHLRSILEKIGPDGSTILARTS